MKNLQRNHPLRLFLVLSISSTLALLVNSVSALPQAKTQIIPLHSLDGLKLVNVKAEPETFKGRKALRVTDAAPQAPSKLS